MITEKFQQINRVNRNKQKLDSEVTLEEKKALCMVETSEQWTSDNYYIKDAKTDEPIAMMLDHVSINTMMKRRDLVVAAPDLLKACEVAKQYLEPDLIEPGRTVFWNLVEAIKKAKGD